MHLFEEIKTLKAKERLTEQRNIATLQAARDEINTMFSALAPTEKKPLHSKKHPAEKPDAKR